MSEATTFEYDIEGMEELDKLFTTETTTMEDELAEARKALESARTAVMEAEKAYGVACQQAQAAHAAAMQAWAQQAGPKGPAPTYTPPSRANVESAKNALAQAEQAVLDIQKELENIKEVANAIKETIEHVKNSQEEVKTFILKNLCDISKFSVERGTRIVNALTQNSVKALDGFDYVLSSNGDKVYTGMYTDLTKDEYVTLAKSIGLESTLALMGANGQNVYMGMAVMSGVCGDGNLWSLSEVEKHFNSGAMSDGYQNQTLLADAVKGKAVFEDGRLNSNAKHTVFTADGTTVYANGSADSNDTYTGKQVRMDHTAYESAGCFGYNTTQSNIINDTLESGGYTYVDENGLYRSAKTAGVRSDDDYYIVAMGNGFGQAAAQVDSHCTEIKEYSWGDAYTNNTGVQGAVQTGYTFEVELKDESGNTYSIDVMMGDIKASKGGTLFPHDVPVEFVVDGKPGSNVSTGGNVDWQKLVGGTGTTEVTGISAYEDGARYTTNYITGGLEHAVYN